MNLPFVNILFKQLGLFLLVIFCCCTTAQKEECLTNYHTDGDWIIGTNLDRYNNRPLYINNTNGFILTGDKPLIRLVKQDMLFGNLVVSVKRNEQTIPVYDFEQVESRFGAGQAKWILRDSRLGKAQIMVNVMPASAGIGMVVQVETANLEAGDELIWTFGGRKKYEGRNLSGDFDTMGHPELLEWKDTRGEEVAPDCQGVFPTANKAVQFLEITINSEARVICQTGEEAQKAFRDAQAKLNILVGRMKINTPDPFLNVIARASVTAIDGSWYPPVFVHGCMLWNTPFPGWRTMFGGTIYGWHDQVREEARYYTSRQVKESDKKEARADPQTLLTEQHPDSRFYGVGRIAKDQNFYNMQSQFFDQLVEEYRWTNDPELTDILREALELHLIWIRDCFDPDGDGTYESYLNSFPTDSQWYNGGGTAEETAYAYRGHKAARDMARNAGDKISEDYHNQMLEKIENGFFSKLWITGKGHPGAYREQGGHERLHEDPWLYSIFLPIDAGLTSPLQAIESVYYSEWALQNDTIPYGGRQVWTSNWVPGIWSVRERWPGDNYHLALSYYQAGLPNDGWDILRGTYTHTAFNHLVPGNFGGHQGGTDFGDCVHPFSRTLVEGLFGFRPDYPNGTVTINPQFPSGWEYASLVLPDFSIDFKQDMTTLQYTFELAKEAEMDIRIPVRCSDVKQVTLNSEATNWKLEPGAGCSILKLHIKKSKVAKIIIEQTDTLPYYNPVFIEGNVGETLILSAQDAKVVSFEDPQGAIEDENVDNGVITARFSNAKGYHTVVAEAEVGPARQYRIFRLKIRDPEGDAKEASRYLGSIPQRASWECIDIPALHNSDITAIYRQQYLSPRPNTVSVRLGTDGYSPWTFWHWKSIPPEIKTDQVKDMLTDKGLLVTPQGVPFKWNTGERNIAFTSMWENYPVKINFPVNKVGKAIYFLVSGSTNVMQCQIANAVIRLNYSDGQCDSLELVPPKNYWNLSPISSNATAPGQGSRNDYTCETDKFCMPDGLPQTVQLGENCRAMLLNLKMQEGVELESIALETLSQEVVVGLIGATILK